LWCGARRAHFSAFRKLDRATAPGIAPDLHRDDDGNRISCRGPCGPQRVLDCSHRLRLADIARLGRFLCRRAFGRRLDSNRVWKLATGPICINERCLATFNGAPHQPGSRICDDDTMTKRELDRNADKKRWKRDEK